jgi:hypothetical protein
MQVAHTQGRVKVPNDLAEHIPLWFVIQGALDEVEARRVRSNRSRPAKTSSSPDRRPVANPAREEED